MVKKPLYIIGIDEAGRGPLAGPVVVAGVRLELTPLLRSGQGVMNHESRGRIFFKNIRDSKKLSAKQREKWFRFLTKRPKIEWAVAKVWPKVIDRINISEAANLGALRVYRKLNSQDLCERRLFGKVDAANAASTGVEEERRPAQLAEANGKTPDVEEKRRKNIKREHTLLDGGLKLPSHIFHESIIKGDEKIPVISAASIIAKVTRDRLMLRLHKKYPQYRFDIHKGYPTKLHRKLIKKFGKSEVHRKSFRC